MVLETCQVKFENINDNAVFYAGDTVKGTICFELSKPKKLSDLSFDVKGVVKCRWRKTGYGQNALGGTVYSCKEELFTSGVFSLVKGYPRTDGNVTLEAGQHELPFSFTLPSSVPTSFESKYGRVRYTFNITANQTKFFSIDDHYKKVLSVVSRCDLNDNLRCSEPTQRKAHKIFSSLFINKGQMDMAVNLPMTGFVPGQDMVIRCIVRNLSQVNVTAVKFRFFQLTTYKANYPRKSTLKEETIIREYSGSGADRGRLVNHPVSITVPALPPSTMYKSYINIQYFLKVKAITAGSHGNVSVTIPLTIGNVPLYKSFHRNAREMNNGGPSTSRTRESVITPSSTYPMDSDGPPAYYDMAPPTYEESQASYTMVEEDPEDKEDDVHFSPTYPVFQFPRRAE